MGFNFGRPSLVRRKANKEIRFKAKGKKLLKEIEAKRELVGLESLNQKLRSCLKCEKEFESGGANNRMCSKCGGYFTASRFPDHHI